MNFQAIRMVVHSDDMRFWITNDNQKVTTYDTFANRYDTISILRANIGSDGQPLSRNYDFRVLRQEVNTVGSEIGTESIHDLAVLPNDTDSDGLPDDVALSYLLNLQTSRVYFNRASVNDEWVFVPYSADTLTAYEADQVAGLGLWKREIGAEGLNFLWMHRTPRYHLIDPAAIVTGKQIGRAHV